MSECNKVLQAQDRPYPRTCAHCGLGPCTKAVAVPRPDWHPLSEPTQEGSPLDIQVAGGHYKDKKIQPVEYISANNLNFLEGCIVKRITRWRDKPAESRFQDLEKIKHEVDLLIEMEKRYG